MDEFGTVSHSESSPVPDHLRGLFNNPDDVRVQKLPRAGLEDRGSMAVFFGAGARTVPHRILAATGLTSSEIVELQNLLDRATANLDGFNPLDDGAGE